MSPLERISRDVAATIPGSRALRGGGLAFTRRGLRARVEFAGAATDVLFDTGDLVDASLQVSSAGLWHDLKNLVGWRDFQVGEADFDRRFDIAASEAGFARRVLGPEMRGVLRSLDIFGDFVWRVSRAGFLLRVRALPQSPRDLDRALMAAFQLLEALPGLDDREKVRLGPATISMGEDSSCQVCGTPLSRGAVVRCAKCSTPHHRDCWEFNGRCSTFACGETKTRR